MILILLIARADVFQCMLCIARLLYHLLRYEPMRLSILEFMWIISSIRCYLWRFFPSSGLWPNAEKQPCLQSSTFCCWHFGPMRVMRPVLVNSDQQLHVIANLLQVKDSLQSRWKWNRFQSCRDRFPPPPEPAVFWQIPIFGLPRFLCASRTSCNGV